MASEIKIFYPAGNSLQAVVYSEDGSKVWTSTGFQPRISSTDLKITLTDSANKGLYVGSFPTGINAAGNYPVEIEEVTTGGTVGSQSINWNGIATSSEVTVPVVSYSTVNAANIYFGTRLYVNAWTTATDNNKQLALNEATRIINRFRYVGRKTVDSQPNEWPRSYVQMNCQTLPDDSIPSDILSAQFEIALALLKGFDVEREARSAGVTSRGYSSVRITYDTKLASEWTMYGVPSYVAWVYLLPFLHRNGSGGITLHRVS